MNTLWSICLLPMVLLVWCEARATDPFKDRELIQDVGDDSTGSMEQYVEPVNTMPVEDFLQELKAQLTSLKNQQLEEEIGSGYYSKRYQPRGYVPSRGKRVPDQMDSEIKRRVTGFYGSRGKRLIPGLESLLLARYYRDAQKWKRQPHPGFHGTRG